MRRATAIAAAVCLAHGCASSAKVHPRVTLFDGASPQPARVAVSDSLLFDPNPGATNPASFVRAEWPCTTRADEGTWRVTTHDQQGCVYGRDHYSRVFHGDRRGP